MFNAKPIVVVCVTYCANYLIVTPQLLSFFIQTEILSFVLFVCLFNFKLSIIPCCFISDPNQNKKNN